jgi:SAM-dependent methyltransferase
VDYREINRKSWNNRVDAHMKSAFYAMDDFMIGASSLKEIELNLLGDISGKSILHLQCHFGQDSFSLERLGAHVTGIDLSDKAISTAHELAEKLNSKARFICCDLYDLPSHLQGSFDVVFTSYGTIGWLPDLDKWAQVIAHFLKPGGQFIFAEFHPVVWMFDDQFDRIAYRYFNSGEIVESESGTYADRQAEIQQEYVMWNHGLGEVINSLVKAGLNLLTLEEFDYSPWNCFSETYEAEPGKFRIQHLQDRIPMVYALSAIKK